MGVITCFLIHGWESLWYKHVILLIKGYFSNYWILLDRGLWGLQTADGAAVSCRPAPVTREVSRHKSQLTLHSSPPCYWKYEAEREQRESRERLPISRICSAADCGLDWPWQEPLATICSCLLPELLGFQLRNLVRSLIGKIDLCFWLKKIILNGIIGVKT